MRPAPRLRSWSEAGSAASVLEWHSGRSEKFPCPRDSGLVCLTQHPLTGATACWCVKHTNPSSAQVSASTSSPRGGLRDTKADSLPPSPKTKTDEDDEDDGDDTTTKAAPPPAQNKNRRRRRGRRRRRRHQSCSPARPKQKQTVTATATPKPPHRRAGVGSAFDAPPPHRLRRTRPAPGPHQGIFGSSAATM